jgi:hypothetical protein
VAVVAAEVVTALQTDRRSLTSGRRSLPSQCGRLSMASSELDALLDVDIDRLRQYTSRPPIFEGAKAAEMTRTFVPPSPSLKTEMCTRLGSRCCGSRASSLRAWFRLIVEVLPKHVPAAASFGLDLNVVGQVGVRIFSVVPIHWDQAALLWRDAMNGDRPRRLASRPARLRVEVSARPQPPFQSLRRPSAPMSRFRQRVIRSQENLW